MQYLVKTSHNGTIQVQAVDLEVLDKPTWTSWCCTCLEPDRLRPGTRVKFTRVYKELGRLCDESLVGHIVA